MIIRLPTLLFALLVSTGCQTMGNHFDCMAEVDRTVPAKIEKKFIRTDTKCVQSNETTVRDSFGNSWGTVPSSRGDINCSSTPIYENIILNQPQRDSAYRNCRNRLGNSSQRKPIGKSVYSLKEAEEACTSATVKDSENYKRCVAELVKTSQGTAK